MSENMGKVLFSAVMASVSPTIDAQQIRLDNGTEVAPISGSFFDDATPVATASNAIRVLKSGDLRFDRVELGRTSDESEVFPPVSGLFSNHLIPPKSAQEVEALYSEHSELVVRSFEEGLSPQEKRRFGLVRWHLHQIQSARQGTQLAQLEQRAQEYTDFAAQIAQLKAEIFDKLPKRKHR
jgi:hypothetical protein